MPTNSQASAPDLAAIERDLRGWSWATGGWASLHVLGGILVVMTGALSQVPSKSLRLMILVVIASWATTAITSWQFRRSFRADFGVIAAVASMIAGLVLLGAAVSLSSLEGAADGIAHLGAGVGLARAVRRARPLLLFG
jgi:cation transport ATPase